MPNTPTPDSYEGDNEQIEDEFTIKYNSEAEREKAIQDAIGRHPARKYGLYEGDMGEEVIAVDSDEPECTLGEMPTEVGMDSLARARRAAIGYTCITDANGFNLE
jgi:hypothetical protein